LSAEQSEADEDRRRLEAVSGVLVTLLMVAIAGYGIYWVWQEQKSHPWTRDAQVLAQVAHVAPRVGGLVIRVHVADDQLVARGAPLFAIEPAPFELAVRQAESELALRRAESEVALARLRESERRGASDAVDAAVARTRFEASSAAVSVGEVALERARQQLAAVEVRSPVDGVVTHLTLTTGSSVAAGVPQVAILDTDSFWVTAYFEETVLHDVPIGAPARVTLLGHPTRPLQGHVASIARGIDRPDQASAPGQLAEVSPTFEWIRLAQRIPVRIHLDAVPADVVLRMGASASVAINPSRPISGMGAF
jgi:multidrug resistance efflux pump